MKVLKVTSIVVVLGLLDLGTGRYVFDLTHTLDEGAPNYPLPPTVPEFTYFRSKLLLAQFWRSEWTAVRKVEFYEHLGTHIDAPIHFGAGRQTLEEIPARNLIGPGVVLDVREKVKNNSDYVVTVQDITDHEKEYGTIPKDAIVLMNSGWGKYYPNPQLMYGTENVTDVRSFHFPGWSLDACRVLLQERRISVVGVDTPSVDPGYMPRYDCHVLLQTNNIVLLEYAANLDSIPPRGTTIVLGAPKIRNGTGVPTRVLAFLEEVHSQSMGVSEASLCYSCTNLLAALTLTLCVSLSRFLLRVLS